MKQRWYLRALMAGTIGLSIVAGLARAGEPPTQPLPSGPAPTQPAITVAPYGAPMQQPLQAMPVDDGAPGWGGEKQDGDCGCDGKHGSHRPHVVGHICKGVKGFFGCDCYSHHNSYGCGSFKSDMTFMFGSCRDFYGEPCMKGPPESPIPPPGSPLYNQTSDSNMPFGYSSIPSAHTPPSSPSPTDTVPPTAYKFTPGGYR